MVSVNTEKEWLNIANHAGESTMFEEGEFDNCADVLDDWFNSCNMQGTAEMGTAELAELLDCMREIERRKSDSLDEEYALKQSRIEELEAENAALRKIIRMAMEGTWWDGNEGWHISRLETWLKCELEDLLPPSALEDE